MDEMGARTLMQRMSVTEAPPSGVDIALARQRGARRLRRRRWAAGAAPLLAAAAVAAVVVGTGVLSRAAGPVQGAPWPVSPVRATPPDRFDPLAPYAAFGWLPAGVRRAANSPSSLPTQLTLQTGRRNGWQFSLTVWAPGTCNFDAARVLRGLRAGHHPTLDCMQSSSAGWAEQVIRPAPTVAGRPGFWLAGHGLAWQYAPGAWATLDGYHGSAVLSAGTVLKVASHVRYGAVTAPAIKFAYQLTGLPASWQRASSTYWRAAASGLLGTDLAAGPISSVQAGPARSPFSCWVAPGSARIRLDGVKAVLTQDGGAGRATTQGLCVPDYHGFWVDIQLNRVPGRHAFPLGGVTGLFLHHLHLLGADPANWTTYPLGPRS